MTRHQSLSGLIPDARLERFDVVVEGANVDIMIGLLQVKTPSESATGTDPLHDVHVQGQMLNYLYSMHACAGVQYCFGILSSYQGWRVCWLPGADSMASADLTRSLDTKVDFREAGVELVREARRKETVQSVERRNLIRSGIERARREQAVLIRDLEKQIQDGKKGGETEEKLLEIGEVAAALQRKEQRVVFGGPIVAFNDHERLRNYIMTAVFKMACSPIEAWDVSGQIPTELVFATFYEMHIGDKRLQGSLTYDDALPHPNCKSYAMVKDFGGGRDGRRVWLVCAGEQNQVAVLKFPNVSGGDRELPEQERLQLEQEYAEAEVKTWEDIYGKGWARAVTAARCTAVLMRYIHPIPKHLEALYRDKGSQYGRAVTECFQLWAEKGFMHEDLRWRHVGVCGDGTVILFDLTSVRRIPAKSKREKKAAVQEMWEVIGAERSGPCCCR